MKTIRNLVARWAVWWAAKMKARYCGINWRKREEHSAEFQFGEKMLAAVAVYRQKHRLYWDLVVLTVDVDEDGIDLFVDGNYWERNWSAVEWWLPISELKAGLPDLTMKKG